MTESKSEVVLSGRGNIFGGTNSFPDVSKGK